MGLSVDNVWLQLVTVFSAPNYCGEFDNAGGCLQVEKDLRCSFAIIPVSPHHTHTNKPLWATLYHVIKWIAAIKSWNVLKAKLEKNTFFCRNTLLWMSGSCIYSSTNSLSLLQPNQSVEVKKKWVMSQTTESLAKSQKQIESVYIHNIISITSGTYVQSIYIGYYLHYLIMRRQNFVLCTVNLVHRAFQREDCAVSIIEQINVHTP